MKRASFRGLGAILFKEFITVVRDPMTLFFMLFPPLIEMIAFGYALDNDVRHMAMAVLNEDRTVESRQFLDRLVNTETFRIVGEVQNVEELASEIRKGRAYVGLQIPPHFTRDLRTGHPAQVQMLIDGSNSTTALQALNTALGVALTQSLETLMRGRTSIVIAHRLSTIEHADRIVAMQAGRIVEQGSHAELLARGGLYARLHALQFGGG